MRKFIKNIIRETFCIFIFYSGILSIYSFFIRNRVTILNYHDINGENFERHARYLIKNFNIISLSECISWLKGEKKTNNNLVITFDDGYKSFYREIFPMLKKYNIPATVFLATDYIGSNKLFWFDLLKICFEEKGIKAFGDNIGNIKENFDSIISYLNLLEDDEKKKRIYKIKQENHIDYYTEKAKSYQILSWTEVKEMAASLVCFGAHTMTHPILTKISRDKARKEIYGSKEELEKQIDSEVRFFAYPNGDSTHFNDEIINVIIEAGFSCALTTINGDCKVGDNLFKLKRKVVSGDFNIPCLAAKISGLWITLSRKRSG